MGRLFFFTAILFFTALHARDVVDDTGICKINWTQGFITCIGESAEGQSSFGAKLSAKVLAQRNMLEVIKGVRIDSLVTIKDGMFSSDVIHSRVSGMIRGAQIISNKFNAKRGSAEATAKIFMGKDLLSALLSDPTKLSWNEKIEKFWSGMSFMTTANAATYGYKDKELLKKLMHDFRSRGDKKSSHYIATILEDISKNSYSGIMIDVSGIAKFEKALIVKLVDEAGDEIYPSNILSDDVLLRKNTSVGYMYGFEDARQDKRVFNTPLEIKVKSIYANRRSSLVLTKEQIQSIQSLSPKVLASAKIILVLGD